MRPAILEKFNPFVKVVAILISCVILALTKSWMVNTALFLVIMLSLLLLSNCSLKRYFGTMIPVSILALAIFFSGLKNGDTSAASGSIYQVAGLYSGLLLSTRVLAYVSLGLLFALTTDSKEFIMSLMHQAHIKPKFAYGVLAAVNLIPTLQREWDEVNLAYQARQKKTGILPFGPLFNTLVNGIRWSENVAMAMESKGFDGDGPRTYAIETKVHAYDLVFAVICIGITAVIAILL